MIEQALAQLIAVAGAVAIYNLTIGPVISIYTMTKGRDIPKWAELLQPLMIYGTIFCLIKDRVNKTSF